MALNFAALPAARSQVARRERQRFVRASWLHKAQALPKEQFTVEVEREMTGRESGGGADRGRTRRARPRVGGWWREKGLPQPGRM